MDDKRAAFYGKRLEFRLGILFLIPPILSVFFFVLPTILSTISFFFQSNYGNGSKDLFDGLAVWYKTFTPSGNRDFTSPMPIYLGLMAIAGAYLIKDSAAYNYYELKEKKEETKKDAK